jgi:L-rhamnose mutarotase
MKCSNCTKEVEFSFRFCPYCGNELYINLSEIDLSKKELNDNSFISILNSVYNLIINSKNKDVDLYFHPISRKLISKRFEIEYETEKKISIISSPENIKNHNYVLNERLNSCLFNSITGYSIRITEELISERKTIPLSLQEIENGINSIEKNYSDEYLIKNITSGITNESIKRRLLFISFIQDDNKHMNYFLEESVLQNWFEHILDANIKLFIERNNKSFARMPNTNDINEKLISEEVLNDIVFGYCVKLSESLYPIK